MSDASDRSPEYIALLLLASVASNEGKAIKLSTAASGHASADRKWTLDTYAECLDAVRGKRNYTRGDI